MPTGALSQLWGRTDLPSRIRWGNIILPALRAEELSRAKFQLDTAPGLSLPGLIRDLLHHAWPSTICSAVIQLPSSWKSHFTNGNKKQLHLAQRLYFFFFLWRKVHVFPMDIKESPMLGNHIQDRNKQAESSLHSVLGL